MNIVIHWEWIPLIVTGFFYVLSVMAGGFNQEPENELHFVLMILTGICGFISVIMYIILGIIWLYHHINIV